ncbi:MAG: Outer rane efflux protein, partial [Verrucomicrobiales bacterium]|nr:Outer rane efflux protein [Verrucomicrobiales bacterium]
VAVGMWVMIAKIQFLNVSAAENAQNRPQLSLNQARETAFRNNWDLLAARSDVDIATAQKVISHEFPNPTLALSTMKVDADNHSSATVLGNSLWNRSYDTIAAVNQLFEIGGKRSARQAAALAGFEASRLRLLDAKRVLDLAVTRAYVQAVLADSNAAILRASAASLRKEAEIAETRHKAGDISTADRTQIEIVADRFELDATSAEANSKALRITLQTLIGNPNADGNFGFAEALESLAETRVPIVDPAHLPPRSDVLALEALRRKADADLRLQKAMRVPDPTFFVQYEREPPDKPNTVGFGVSIPIPLWNHNRGAISAAAANQKQSTVLADKARAQFASEVATSQVNYQDAYNRWKRYGSDIVPRSENFRSTISYAYQKGGASLLDLLSAERSDNDIRLAAAQAAADTAVSIASLKAAFSPADEKTTHENAK